MAKRNTKANYISGNVLREEELIREMQQPYVVKNKKRKKNKLNPGMVLFLAVSIGIMMMVFMTAISARAEYTASVKRVSQKEAELNNARLANDEELERIDAAVNLEEIRRIAIEELGMTYAESGQVVTISDEGSDYVRQMVQLP